MAITQTLVVFDWSDLSGGGVSGADYLELSETISDGAITLRPPAVTPTAKLDGMGRAALIVPANDDLTTVPTGTFYKHTGRIGKSVARETKAVTSLGQATVISGAGVPSSGTGTDGEWYVDTNTGNAYGPKLTTWPSPILIGNWDNAVPDGQIYWAQLSQFFPDWGSGGGGAGGGSDGGITQESLARSSAPNQLRTMSGNLPFGGFKATNMAAGTVPGDGAIIDQTSAWILDVLGWTRVSGTSFTLPSLTFVYTHGAKVKWNESGTTKYGVVASSSFGSGVTTVVLMANNDYSMAASPDSGSNFVSYGNPLGFPSAFGFTPTWTGFSAAPTVASCWWSVQAGICTVQVFTIGNGTSNATTATVVAPIGSNANVGASAVGQGTNNGAATMLSATISSGSSSIGLATQPGTGAWTAGGTAKGASFQLVYPI